MGCNNSVMATAIPETKPRGSKRMKLQKYDKQYRAIIARLGDIDTHEKLNDRILATFKQIDEDSSGSIDEKELAKAMDAMGVQLQPRELGALIKEIDTSRDGLIDLEEYQNMVYRKLEQFGVVERPPSEIRSQGSFKGSSGKNM